MSITSLINSIPQFCIFQGINFKNQQQAPRASPIIPPKMDPRMRLSFTSLQAYLNCTISSYLNPSYCLSIYQTVSMFLLCSSFSPYSMGGFTCQLSAFINLYLIRYKYQESTSNTQSLIKQMQHLQIKYEQFSPQLQYLQQHHLLQQEDVHSHHDPFMHIEDHQEFSFQEVHQEQIQNIQTQTYEGYVDSIIRIPQLKPIKKYQIVVKKGINILFGDILNYAYHFHYKRMQILSIFKWELIIETFLFFTFLIYFSFEFTLLLILAISVLIRKEGECESEIVKADAFKNQFTNFSFKIKSKYHQSTINHSSLSNFTTVLFQFVRYLQTNYKLTLIDSTFILDQIDQSLHLLSQLIKNNNFSQHFLTSKWFLPRKYYFWKLRIQNKQLTRIIQIMDRILQEDISSKQVKYFKPKPDQNIYSTILLAKIEKQYAQVKNGKKDVSTITSLLQLLRRELQFKQIFNFHHQPIEQQNHKQDEVQQEDLPVFQEINKPENYNSYFYQNDSLIAYEPQQLENIREKLNALLQQKLKKTQHSVKIAGTTQIIPDLRPQKVQRSIFSFGIPLVPPSRDMSAFYIQ